MPTTMSSELFAPPLPHPVYPQAIEDWWVARAMRESGSKEKRNCLQSYELAVEHLCDLFTCDRPESFGNYSNDPHLLTAYGLFYSPQTYIRTRMVWDELLQAKKWRPAGDEPIQVLDLGSGLGSGMIATAESLETVMPDRPVQLFAVDDSVPAMRTVEQLFRNATPFLSRTGLEMRTTDMRAFLERTTSQWDIILSVFSLNELFGDSNEDELAMQEWIGSGMSKLKPGGLFLVLEPAFKHTSQRLQRIRDTLLATNRATVIAPCLHQANCPMLDKRKIWCHEARGWAPTTVIQMLNRNLKLTVEDLKFSFMAFTTPCKRIPEGGMETMRMVAPMRKMKGKFFTSGCAADGGMYWYEAQTRELNADEKHLLNRRERGDILKWKEPVPLADELTLRSHGLEEIIHRFGK